MPASDMRISDWSSDVCSSDLMNIHYIMGKSTPDFLRDRGFALFDAIFAAVVMTGLIFLVGRISRARFLVNYSLRARLMVGIDVIELVCGGGLRLHVGVAEGSRGGAEGVGEGRTRRCTG